MSETKPEIVKVDEAIRRIARREVESAVRALGDRVAKLIDEILTRINLGPETKLSQDDRKTARMVVRMYARDGYVGSSKEMDRLVELRAEALREQMLSGMDWINQIRMEMELPPVAAPAEEGQ